MALSLVHDFDLLCETKDIQRLTNEFPYNNANNLILMTDDDWQTVWFGKPYLVSLLAAPAVALFGANGFLATNMALLHAVDLARRALPAAVQSGRRWRCSSRPASSCSRTPSPTSSGSTPKCSAWPRSRPASTSPSRRPRSAVPTGRWGRFRRSFWNAASRPAWSGAAIIAGAYNKPILALLGLPALYLAYRRGAPARRGEVARRRRGRRRRWSAASRSASPATPPPISASSARASASSTSPACPICRSPAPRPTRRRCPRRADRATPGRGSSGCPRSTAACPRTPATSSSAATPGSSSTRRSPGSACCSSRSTAGARRSAGGCSPRSPAWRSSS